MSVYIFNNPDIYENLPLESTLSLHSSKSSNIISLETELDKTYIMFENIYNVGNSNNNFVINNKTDNYNIASFNRNQVDINNKLCVKKDLIISENNTTTINSNFIIKLKNDSNTITSFNTNNSKILEINKDGIQASSNLYCINDSVLYVNTIRPVNENDVVNIEKLYLQETAAENATYRSKLLINNNTVIENADPYSDTVAFQINKKDLIEDIVNINVIDSNNSLVRKITINNDGLMGIGTTNPTAVLSLSPINNNILQYQGDKYGDVLKLTKYGKLGIGINEPRSLLDIKRNDDYENNNIRNVNMLNIDMEYDSIKNMSNLIINSNYEINNGMDRLEFNIIDSNSDTLKLYHYKPYDYGGSNEFILLPISFYENNLKNYIENQLENGTQNIILENSSFESVENEIVISVREDIDVAGNNIDIKTKLKIYFLNTDSNKYYINNLTNNIKSTSDTTDDYFKKFNTSLNYTPDFLEVDNVYFIDYDDSNGLSLYNKINIQDIDNASAYVSSGSGVDYYKQFITYDELNYTVDSNNIKSYNKVQWFNDGSLFENYKVKFNIKFYIKIGTYSDFNYSYYKPYQLEPPNMLYITSNNNFVASISGNGKTLSLGEPAHISCNYLLYSPGDVLIENLIINNITTDSEYISYNQHDVSNINKLQCSELHTTGNGVYINGFQISIEEQGKIQINGTNYDLTPTPP